MQKKWKINDHAIGILYILVAAFFFSLMTFFVKLAGDVPTMQKVFFRNAVAMILAGVALARSGEGFHIQKSSWFGLIMRSVVGFAGVIANFWAISRIGLADSNILNKMSPFFAIIMSLFILKEKPNKVEWLSVAVAFTGAVFIVKPGAGLASLPALVGLFGGFCAGTAYTYVRKLGKQGERGSVIVFFFSTFSTLCCVPFLLFDFQPMSGFQWFSLIMAGVSAAGGQFGITAAYTHAPAKEISVFDYTQVIFAALLGLIFFDEVPDVYSLVGYVIIIGVAIFRWYYNLRKSKEEQEEKPEALVK